MIFNLLAGSPGQIIGHKNLVRLGAFLERAGRQDTPNNIADNGEALVQKTVLENVDREVAVVIDCGSNIGQWATRFLDAYKRVNSPCPLQLYCFEPSSYTFAKLMKTLGNYGNKMLDINATQEALSNKSGTLGLKIVHNGAGTNSLVAIPGIHKSEEQVKVTTIDEFSASKDISHIDFLKIDAEGHDLNVIRGGDRLLSNQGIGVIQFEYNWRWIHARHFLLDAFKYLQAKNYAVGKVTPGGIQFYNQYDVALETFVEGNYLACTSEWVKKFVSVGSWLDK